MGKLNIVLVEGKDLIAMDIGGSSDPYIIFKLNGKKIHTSKTIKHSLNPTWNESFVIDVPQPHVDELELQAYDWDLLKADDAMGFVKFTLKKLPYRQKVDLWLNLSTKGALRVTMFAEDFGTSTDGAPSNMQLYPKVRVQPVQIGVPYYIRSFYNNLYLDAKGEGTSNGTETIVWALNKQKNQQWVFESNGSIRNVNSNLVLDVKKSKGPAVVTYSPTNKPNQQWKYDNGYLVSSVNGNPVLDVKGEGTASGNDVIVYKKKDGFADNQLWELLLV